MFTAAERAAVKPAHQFAKELGKRWKALSAEEKALFEVRAAAAKEAYAAQLAVFKQSADFAAHEAAVAAWKRGEKASKAAAEGKGLKVSLPRKPKDTNESKEAQAQAQGALPVLHARAGRGLGLFSELQSNGRL